MGEWNHDEIRVEGKRIRIYLNDELVNDFTSPETEPGRLTWPSYLGLQNHGNGESVFYRDVQLKELADPEDVTPTVTVTPEPAEVRTGRTTQVEVSVDSVVDETPTGDVDPVGRRRGARPGGARGRHGHLHGRPVRRGRHGGPRGVVRR